ncbi:MAG: helix-turn-helix domain-containing protein [Spirochaetaceae bacterium]|jgi:transcriptional regulator with XRE-family HTH domain|nr:helix-turn-helix domain-containing protein [Spirochaetaceae bacterium]
MADFAERLREAIEYSGLLQKEIALKAGIKKRALDMYLGVQKSMPPADAAVQLAGVLGVTVEYLVTGKNPPPFNTDSPSEQDLSQIRGIMRDFQSLPENVRKAFAVILDFAAQTQK